MSTISKTYKWQWKDENGSWAGWNWTNAYTKAEARRIAKKMESKARDFTYDILVDGEVEQTTGHNSGMYLNEKTLRRVSDKDFMATWKASYMD